MSLSAWVDILVYGWFNLDPYQPLAKALHFWIYDSVKIALLLVGITTLMGVFQSYVSVQKLQKFLSSRRWFGLDFGLAALFGALTPFCSCSSVPLFIGFVRGGIPLGVTFAFLITSPLVNEAALAVFIASFGFKVTAIYAMSGVVLGIFGGVILNLWGLEKWLQPWVQQLLAQGPMNPVELRTLTFKARLQSVLIEVQSILKRIIPWVLGGVALGAWMHGYVPAGALAPLLGAAEPWDVPVAVILGIPLYAQAAGVLPLIQVLIAKGVPMGTALAFMMATVGLSIPEAILLYQVMNRKLLAVFFGLIGLLMILLGYFFNLIF